MFFHMDKCPRIIIQSLSREYQVNHHYKNNGKTNGMGKHCSPSVKWLNDMYNTFSVLVLVSKNEFDSIVVYF